MITNDEQIIVKIYLNFILFIARLAIDMMHHGLLIFYSGYTIGFIPSQIYITHNLIKYFMSIVREVEKFRKFRSFLKNLNRDYPLINFEAQQNAAA